MMSITLTIPFLLITSVGLCSIFAMGFFTRTRLEQKLRKRVLELENEMVSNHAEILQLTQQISLLQHQPNANTPVISLGNAKDFLVKSVAQ